MKKFILALIVVFSFCCVPVQAASFGSTLFEKIALYIPNRVLDAIDLFSVNVGVGPVIEARVMATRLIDVGAGANLVTYKFYKNFNRQIGLGIEEGWYWSLIFAGEESFSMLDSTSLIKKYAEYRAGIPDLTTRAYDFFDGPRDYWAIGGTVGFLVDADVYVHPLEWVDLVLGCLLIDIKGDDLTLADLQ